MGFERRVAEFRILVKIEINWVIVQIGWITLDWGMATKIQKKT
jgi:hypothetical protein